MTKNDVNLTELLGEVTLLEPSIFDKDYTKTSLFLLNMLGYKHLTMPPYFINAYIGDDEHESEIDYPIYILFRIDINLSHRDRSWVHYEKNLKEHPAYKYNYYAGRDQQYDLDLVMYVFEVPQQFQGDYIKFLEGKYSEFSDDFKSIFPKLTIVDNQPRPNLHFKVIQRDPALKAQIEEILDTYLDDKAELWAKPTKKREVYRAM